MHINKKMSVNNTNNEYTFQEKCIRNILKQYGGMSEYPLDRKIMQEINTANDWFSGCQFMEYINHKLYAYLMEQGYGPTYVYWEDIDCDSDNEEVEGDGEEEEELISNETDETCPICLEAYDREIGRLKDGIQNSNYESNCPHWCCCMCWDTMSRQDNDTYSCPICKTDITDWLKTHYYSDSDDEEE